MIFNHLVSAIDARVSARSRNADMSDGGLSLRAEPVGSDGSVAVLWGHGF